MSSTGVFVAVWVLGWMLTAVLYQRFLRASGETGEERAKTADLRSSWMDRRRRAATLLNFLYGWPAVLAMVCFYFGMRLMEERRAARVGRGE